MLATKLTNETWRSERGREEEQERERQEEEEGERREGGRLTTILRNFEREGFHYQRQQRPAEEKRGERMMSC